MAREGSLGASHFTKVPMSSTDECRFAVRYKMNDFVDMVSLSWISKQTQHMSLSLSLSLYIYIYIYIYIHMYYMNIMYVCMYVCMYNCIDACIWNAHGIHILVYIYII